MTRVRYVVGLLIDLPHGAHPSWPAVTFQPRRAAIMHDVAGDQVSAAHRINLDNEPTADAVKAMQVWRARALARRRPGLVAR